MGYDKHPLDQATKTITLRKCWSLIFDTNGNAPADATVASFATKELADEALYLFGNLKDNNQSFAIVFDKRKYSQPDTHSVEGYDFDTFYKVAEDWQEDNNIFTSLSDLLKLCSCVEETDLPDGVISDGEGDEEDNEDGDE